MRIFGNIIWVIFFGWWNALLYLVIGLVCCATVILIPVGIQYIKFAGLIFMPFGKEVRYGGGLGKTAINILWAILFGWALALENILIGVVLCCTIFMIPFGLQAFKFAKFSFMPVGSTIS